MYYLAIYIVNSLGIWQSETSQGYGCCNLTYFFLHDLLFVTRYVKQFELLAPNLFCNFFFTSFLYNQLSKSISFIMNQESYLSLMEACWSIIMRLKTNQQYKYK